MRVLHTNGPHSVYYSPVTEERANGPTRFGSRVTRRSLTGYAYSFATISERMVRLSQTGTAVCVISIFGARRLLPLSGEILQKRFTPSVNTRLTRLSKPSARRGWMSTTRVWSSPLPSIWVLRQRTRLWWAQTKDIWALWPLWAKPRPELTYLVTGM